MTAVSDRMARSVDSEVEVTSKHPRRGPERGPLPRDARAQQAMRRVDRRLPLDVLEDLAPDVRLLEIVVHEAMQRVDVALEVAPGHGPALSRPSARGRRRAIQMWRPRQEMTTRPTRV